MATPLTRATPPELASCGYCDKSTLTEPPLGRPVMASPVPTPQAARRSAAAASPPRFSSSRRSIAAARLLPIPDPTTLPAPVAPSPTLPLASAAVSPQAPHACSHMVGLRSDVDHSGLPGGHVLGLLDHVVDVHDHV